MADPPHIIRVPLSEERVRQLSRSIRSSVPSTADGDNIKDFDNLLNHVLFTSAYATLGTTHRVSAWNTLCSLIDQALESDLPEVREIIWASNSWNRALDLYLCHAQSSRPKSARQLLVTLTNALRRAPLHALPDLKPLAIQRLVSCLLDFQDPFQAKASAQLLSHLITKEVVDVENVLHTFAQQSQQVGVEPSLGSRLSGTLEIMFSWLGNGDFGSTIAQLIAAILDRVSLKDAAGKPIWADPLEKAYGQNAANVDDLRAHIFPMLFKRSFSDFASFLQNQGLDRLLQTGGKVEFLGESVDELLFVALQTGKELGILLESDDTKLSYTSPSVSIPVQLIGRLLLKRSRSARLTGLSLLITSHSTTRPLSLATLNLARRSFGVFFADVDADFRSEVFSAFSRLIDRIRGISAVLVRQATQQMNQSLDVSATNRILQSHQDFLKRMVRFLTWELRPTGSYQRHISALKCISILARSGLDENVPVQFYSKSAQGETKWAFRIRILTNDLQRLLLDTLLDPFDDVRATASIVLGFYCSTTADSGVLQQPELALTLERAEALMLATGRADHADGVAHLYSLCYRRCGQDAAGLADFWSSRQAFLSHLVSKLEQMLAIAKRNLADAVERYPMHGLLTSWRYVLQQDQAAVGMDMQSRLFEYLHEIWEVVKPILCNDAPEGFIPEELEDTPESTKESLSYCWRALKEASLLLSSLISTQPNTGSTDILHKMSMLCFTQLAELRHRGAFSTVAQTWQSCCMRCKDLRGPDGFLMLESWYSDVLEILRKNVTINTRRSAGLPSLLCGILVADKSGTLLSNAFTDLEAIARKDVDAAAAEEGSLAQVHAMNCLKDILKNTRLGEQTQHRVPVALQLAADALRSEVWAVRNCGLMLFRAVIDRLLGTNEQHFEDEVVFQKRISADQHPALLDVVLGLLPRPALTAQDSSVRYESVFPALQLLQHTRIPPARLDETKIAVGTLTASNSWHVRDKAARTLASLVDPSRIPVQLANVLGGATSQNSLHGALLTAKYIVEHARRAAIRRTAPIEPDSEDTLSLPEEYLNVNRIVAEIYRETPSVVTKAACVDFLRECCALLSHAGAESKTCKVHQFFFEFAESSLHEQGVAEVYVHLLSQCLYDTSAAVLRQAWARYAAHHIANYKLGTTKEAESLVYALLELARRDGDAVSYFLVTSDWERMPNGGKGTLVTDLCIRILASDDFAAGLKYDAQRTLLALLPKIGAMTVELQQTLDNIIDKSRKLETQDSNQQYVDSMLQLQALSFEGSDLKNLEKPKLMTWADDCVSAVNGTGIHTREAATEAMGRLQRTWSVLAAQSSEPSSEATQKAFSSLCCAVYDLLNDDDEDIRLLAAAITNRILSAATEAKDVDFEPIGAGQKLLVLYTSRAGSGSECISDAFSKAYGLTYDTPATPVADQLAELSQSDTALFAEEKQNLYVDDSQEVRVWSQVVGKLLAVQQTPQSQDEYTSSLTCRMCGNRGHLSGDCGRETRAMVKVLPLVDWVSNGLDELAKRAESDHDAALGWSTGADVFVLGLKVIHGAEVVLQVKNRGIPVPALETKLFACSKAFESGGVNCLWKWEVERVLSDAVMGKLGALNGNTVNRYQVGA